MQVGKKGGKKQVKTKAVGAGPSDQKAATISTIFALGFGVLVVLTMTLVWASFFLFSNSLEKRTLIVREEISEYLNEKYDEKFVVASPERNGNTLGSPEEWRVVAHPYDRESLVFEAGVIVVNGDNKYHDYYVQAIRTEEQTIAIRQKAKETYGSEAPTTISAKVVFGPELLRVATKDTPTYEESIRDYSDDLWYLVTIRSNDTPRDRAVYDMLRAQDLIQWVRSQGYEDVRLSYTATDESGAKSLCYTSTPPSVLTKTFTEACFSKNKETSR